MSLSYNINISHTVLTIMLLIPIYLVFYYFGLVTLNVITLVSVDRNFLQCCII